MRLKVFASSAVPAESQVDEMSPSLARPLPGAESDTAQRFLGLPFGLEAVARGNLKASSPTPHYSFNGGLRSEEFLSCRACP